MSENPFIIDKIPKVITPARLFSKNDPIPIAPSIDDAEWIDIEINLPGIYKCSPPLWVKTDRGEIFQAFYCQLPLFSKGAWVDRWEDFFVNNITHWMDKN